VPVRMLSTGQRKRATLARILASCSDIWLLDEPANGLDLASLEVLSQLIASHRASGGIVLAASHQSLGIEQAQDIRLEARP
jgi:heme exporter protein A